MTYIEIVNAVLRRMRESPVASVADNDYSAMLGEWVNEVKREVEDAWSWSFFNIRQSTSINAFADTFQLGEGVPLTYVGSRSKLKRLWNLSNETDMFLIDADTMWRYMEEAPLRRDYSQYWRIEGLNNELQERFIRIWPLYSSAQSFYIYGFFPQRDLADDAQEMKLPPWPVILGTYALALAERGDDRGDTVTRAQANYQQAVADAIAIDASNQHHSESAWHL